ncbi:hypothetical protein BDP27DRAFT_1158830, partial [Rhodocollybia butyracea]
SFVEPFQDELVQLAHGVSVVNAETKSSVTVRGYKIHTEGDMRSQEKTVKNKSVNGFSACGTCEVKGIRYEKQGSKIYYIPLAHPILDQDRNQLFDENGHPLIHEWDASSLPYRSHESFAATVAEIERAPTKAAKATIQKSTGIKSLPIFQRVESMHYGRSSPRDWMHLFLNVIPNLIDLWTGRFKNIHGDYEIQPAVWEMIGEETASSAKLIPAAFTRRLPNIATERAAYNAEAYIFWFMYVMPIVLKDRFENPFYYTHACALRDIMSTTIQFTITKAEIETLRISIINWVRAYEK